MFKKVILKIGDNSAGSYWLTYLLSPVLMVLLSYIVGSLFEKVTPKLYSIAVGNRKNKVYDNNTSLKNN